MNLFVFVFFIWWVGSSSTKFRAHKKTNGYDHRPLTESPSKYYLIAKFFEKKQLLDVLENPRIPLHIKTRMLAEPSTNIHPPNMYAGGLMESWTFDMDEPDSGDNPNCVA